MTFKQKLARFRRAILSTTCLRPTWWDLQLMPDGTLVHIRTPRYYPDVQVRSERVERAKALYTEVPDAPGSSSSG